MPEVKKAPKTNHFYLKLGIISVAIVGIPAIIFFAWSIWTADPPPRSYSGGLQTCLSAPGSLGCKSCKDGDDPYDGLKFCGKCENEYKIAADSASFIFSAECK